MLDYTDSLADSSLLRQGVPARELCSSHIFIWFWSWHWYQLSVLVTVHGNKSPFCVTAFCGNNSKLIC